MNEINQTIGKRKKWTSSNVEKANSPYYPLSLKGQLCPILNDKKLLFEIYEKSGYRKDIKRFCKTHYWEKKPSAIYSINDNVLANLIITLCNAPSVRKALGKQHFSLHNAIWAWSKNQHSELHDILEGYCYTKKKAIFIKPEKLNSYLDECEGKDDKSKLHNILISLAFTMLESDDRYHLIAVLANRFPDITDKLGLNVEKQVKNRSIIEKNDLETKTNPKHNNCKTKPNPSSLSQETNKIYSNNTPNVKCWGSYSKDLKRLADDLDKEVIGFNKNFERLSEIETLNAYKDGEDVENILSLLDKSRKIITKKGLDILSLLQKSCSGSHNYTCELQRYLHQIEKKPPSTIDGILQGIRLLNDKANDLKDRERTAKKTLKETIHKAELLANSLGKEYEGKQITNETELPCYTIAAVVEHKKGVAELQRKINVEVDRRKEKISNQLDRIFKQYDIGNNPRFEKYANSAEKLRDLVDDIDDLTGTEDCEKLLEELEGKCRHIEKYDYRKIAASLLNDPSDFKKYITLGRALIEQGLPEVAYLLMHIRQKSYVIEEIVDATDAALFNLLDAACATIQKGTSIQSILMTLCAEPWLISIEQNDIESSELHERMIGLLIGVALGGYSEEVAHIFVRIGAGDVSRKRFPSLLDQIVQALIMHKPIHIIEDDALQVVQLLEEDLHEKLRMEGGKFRHIQCGKAHHYARFETMQVFPALIKLWENISLNINQRKYSVANQELKQIKTKEWYDALVRQHDNPIDNHPHFPNKIQNFISSYINNLQTYVNKHRAIWDNEDLIVSKTKYLNALERWAGTQTIRKNIIYIHQNILQNLDQKIPKTQSIWFALSLCPTIISQCPRYIAWYRQQNHPTASLQLEKDILNDLKQEYTPADVIQQLETSKAWNSLIIAFSNNKDCVVDWKTNRNNELYECQTNLSDIEIAGEKHLLSKYDDLLQQDRLPAAQRELNKWEERKSEAIEKKNIDLLRFVKKSLSLIDNIRDRADDANMPDDWHNKVEDIASTVVKELRKLKRADKTLEVEEKRISLDKTINALDFIVQQQTNVFDEVEELLQKSDTPRIKKRKIRIRDLTEEAYKRCPELLSAWDILTKAETEVDNYNLRTWPKLAKAFSKACNLYHDERDEKKRYKQISSISYPFAVFETDFYKPRSEFLKRHIRLYLYREDAIDIQALQRLEQEVTGDFSATFLHIIFAPQGSDRIKRYFKYNTGFRDFLIIDEKFLHKVCAVEKHDVPVRIALHASVKNLTSASPFVAQGFVDENENIYVGRKIILQKLQNTPHSMIWGGRRIGKTSVLHALKNSLEKRGYKVALVYVVINSGEDPYIAVAQMIAKALGLPSINSVRKFGELIDDLCNKNTKIAFLIDEVDAYIKVSRERHKKTFPLASTLRQFMMSNSGKDIRLVYSGYHQLYYETNFNYGNRPTEHPFVNTTQNIPIRNLTVADVRELVITGFKEMLDVDVSADVPRLIYERASGHPAFIQHFCRCLVEVVDKRRTLSKRTKITADDVKNVYFAETRIDGGEQPFINYVNETLGYNLSALGRAIMLIISDHLKNGDAEQAFSSQFVQNELNDWFDVFEMEPPKQEHYKQTIELLVMTNMLRQVVINGSNMYKITYTAFIDILQRLDKTGKAEIGMSLTKYDETERKNGILK